ncbi:MAG: hypothetical protein WC227_01770 [Patescibacteria group bacterium]|jgi:hypothetical protein
MVWLRRLLALFLFVILMTSYALALFYCQGSLLPEYQQWYSKTIALIAIWFVTVTLMVGIYDYDRQLNAGLTDRFFLPLTAPVILPCYLLVQSIAGQIGFNWSGGYLSGWCAIAQNLLYPWRGLLNRIATIAVGIVVFGVYWLIIGWACGAYPPFGVFALFRWIIAIILLWMWAVIVQGQTYEKQFDSEDDFSTLMAIAGPLGTIWHFLIKLWDGDPLNQERQGTDCQPLPLYKRLRPRPEQQNSR